MFEALHLFFIIVCCHRTTAVQFDSLTLNNEVICAVGDKPKPVTLPSISAVALCEESCTGYTDTCLRYNWYSFPNGSTVCEMFTSKPTAYASVPNCVHFTADANDRYSLDCVAGVKWRMYENSHSVGAKKYTQYSTTSACLEACVSTVPNCVAADVDANFDPILCWLHVNHSVLDMPPRIKSIGVNQFRISSQCPDPECLGGAKWVMFEDSHCAGAELYEQYTTTLECLGACINTVHGCVAVDVDTNFDTINCWLHVNPKILASPPAVKTIGVNEFRITSLCKK